MPPFFSPGAAYAVLAAFAGLLLCLTIIWYKRLPATSTRTAEWYFTAGRNMKAGVIAASIVCTWTWASTLMTSSAKGYMHGIAGPYWYAAGASVPILLFAVLAIYLKRRMPMAHTFGEFVWHRFGPASHRLLVGLGLFTCMIVTVMVVLGGAYALRVLTGLDVRVAVLLIPLAFAFYSALGGLRGAILMEYLQLVVLLGIALTLTIWFWTSHGDLGIFERLSAVPPREGEIYLAMASLPALLFGIVNTIGNLGAVFLDQTYWQRAIAGSDQAAGRSFLIGGLAWFAIPFGIGTALGVGGLALGIVVPFPYSDVAPATAAIAFGPVGAWLFLVMLFMAILSTGNAESVAVASLVATDIYKRYLRPEAGDAAILRVARVTVLSFALLVGPVCLALHSAAIDMEWLYLAMGIFLGSGVIPLALGFLTDRLTGRGAYCATLGGVLLGLVTWFATALIIEGEITIRTLGALFPVTIGNIAGILTSGLICLIDCFRPHIRFKFETLQTALLSFLTPREAPAMPQALRVVLSGPERRLIGWVVGLSVLLDLIIPVGLYLTGIRFGPVAFAVWVILTLVWLMIAAGFVVLLPMVDYFQQSSSERLGQGRGGRSGPTIQAPHSVGTRLFLAFLTVVLTLGVGAIVSLVKLGSVEYLRQTMERILMEGALHEELVFTVLPRVLQERRNDVKNGPAAFLLAERSKVLIDSPHTPPLLRSLLGPEAPIPYLGFGERERELLAASIEGAYRGSRNAILAQMGEERQEAIALLLVSLIGTVTVGLILTIRTSISITRPVRRLAEASGHFAAGDMKLPPVQPETEDEIGELTKEFNVMAGRIREQMSTIKSVEKRFRLVAEAANDVIYDWWFPDDTVEWAATTKGIFGYLPDEIGPSSQWWMGRIHPDDRAVVNAKVEECLRLNKDFLGEYRFRRRDGSYALVRDNGLMVLGEDGRAIRMVGTLKDVTNEREMEAQLRQAQKMEAVGQLAGGIAHDFNNILTGILGNLSLAMMHLGQGHPVKEFLKSAEQAGRRAAELTRQLLAFGRRSMSQPREVFLPSLVEEAVGLLRRTIDPRIVIHLEEQPAVWPVRADPTQMHQILMNLGVNARDAMPEGGRLLIDLANVTIDAAYCASHPYARPGRYVCLAVSDTGVGMDEATREHIFDPFFTTKEVGKGTGLGLAMIYGIVKQHEGWVTVDSGLGRGTTFYVYLPAAPEALIEPEIGHWGGPKPLGGRECLLVVDDDEAIRSFAREFLASYGYTVLLAEDGEAALQVLNAHEGRIELVVLDLTMPKLNGRQVLQKLRTGGHQIPVILSSGYMADGAVQDLIGLGQAQAFVAKPYSPEELLRKVRGLLDHPHVV
jgi:SSS family transporter